MKRSSRMLSIVFLTITLLLLSLELSIPQLRAISENVGATTDTENGTLSFFDVTSKDYLSDINITLYDKNNNVLCNFTEFKYVDTMNSYHSVYKCSDPSILDGDYYFKASKTGYKDYYGNLFINKGLCTSNEGSIPMDILDNNPILNNGIIQGHVINNNSKTPIDNISLFLYRNGTIYSSVTTNPYGDFIFDNLPDDGIYALITDDENYSKYTECFILCDYLYSTNLSLYPVESNNQQNSNKYSTVSKSNTQLQNFNNILGKNNSDDKDTNKTPVSLGNLNFQFKDSISSSILSDINVEVYDDKLNSVGIMTGSKDENNESMYTLKEIDINKNYSFVATLEGFDEFTGSIDNSKDFNNTKSIELNKSIIKKTLSLQFTNNKTSDILSGVDLKIYDSDGNIAGTPREVIDSSGNTIYYIDNLDIDSTYTFDATKDKFNALNDTISNSIDFSKIQTFEMSLIPVNGSLEFEFKDKDSLDTISNVFVHVYDSNNNSIDAITESTDSNGNTIYKLNNIDQNETYKYTAISSEYQALTGTINNSHDFSSIKTVLMTPIPKIIRKTLKIEIKDSSDLSILSNVNAELYESKSNKFVGYLTESESSKQYLLEDLDIDFEYYLKVYVSGFKESKVNISSSDFSDLKTITVDPLPIATGTLNFQFKDKDTLESLSGMLVSVTDKDNNSVGTVIMSVNSNGDSIYTLTNIDTTGSYILVSSKDGYNKHIENIDNTVDFSTTKSIQMEPIIDNIKTGNLNFTVIDSDSSKIMDGVIIKVYDSNNLLVGVMYETTDSDNNPLYSLNNVNLNGSYHFIATKDDYKNLNDDVYNLVDFSSVKTLSLEKIPPISTNGSIILNLKNSNGSIISDALVSLIDLNGNKVDYFSFDNDLKKWKIDNIDPNDYNLQIIVNDDQQVFSQPLKVIAGQTTNLTGTYRKK